MNDPIYYTWTDDGAMKPLPRFAPRCDQEFVVGATYRLEVVKQRSKVSHDHYFACLHEAWLQLPESVAKEFLNEIKFRKWALIQAGYYEETRFKVASPVDAMTFAACCAGLDEYAEVIIDGDLVAVRKAKSQSRAAMGNKVFQQSKTAVLDVVTKIIGVDPTTLARNAGRAA